MPALLALLLLIGGGVSVAAEQSVPGDILYPVKINFNEEVRSILAVTDQDEARWQTQAAERRLFEAETLTERGELDEATRIVLEEEFTASVNSAEEHTANLVAAGELASASDIILNLESALSAHREIITQLTTAANTALATDTGEEGTTMGEEAASVRTSIQIAIDELGKLSQKVDDKLEEVSVSREAVDVQLLAAADREDEAETLARNREKSAEARLRTVRGHLENRRSNKGVGSGIEAEASLLAADNALDRGRAAIGEKDFGNAYKRYQEAIKQALEADAFLRVEEEKDAKDTEASLPDPSLAPLVPVGSEGGTALPEDPAMSIPDGSVSDILPADIPVPPLGDIEPPSSTVPDPIDISVPPSIVPESEQPAI